MGAVQVPLQVMLPRFWHAKSKPDKDVGSVQDDVVQLIIVRDDEPDSSS